MNEKGMRAYEDLKDISIPQEQEEMMNIICGAWEECQRTDCSGCDDRAKKYMPLMACTSLKYTRWLLANGYKRQSKGEWQLVGYGNGRPIGWKCSACGGTVYDASNGNTDFCPNCGANMEGEQK